MNPELDLDAAAAWVDTWQRSIEERATQAKQLHDAVSRLAAAGRDRSGCVEVTVTSTGSLADIWLSERVRQQPVTETRAQLLEAFNAARVALHRRVAQTTTDLLGNDSPLTKAMLESLARQADSRSNDSPSIDRRPSG
jgi:hypothetical protein